MIIEMRTILLIATLFTFSASSFSQDLTKKEQKKLYKQFEKEQQAEEAARKAELVHVMVLHRQFVLEADQLRDKRGSTIQVSSMINFIAADSTRGVIQVGSNFYVGANGVGGITVEGPISNYEFTYNEKNGSHNVTYNLRTSYGTHYVRMNISSNGRANATVSSNWPGTLNYLGYVKHPAKSKVYKGSSF